MARIRPEPHSSLTDEELADLFAAEGLSVPAALRDLVWQEARTLKQAALRLREGERSPYRAKASSR